uniref:Protein kinase domain-containing protein n=1 Tax=Chromera velia CCMP2878 TaxID=1169474 RepID=A0A0G4HB62_9ALVE|eukprot:Cvel_25742.t1-p1 / transcript=Cvel_25742.t1 / gene=Cvel_25742 / organism=Chromera_velia_CCMP2878 / gene_product=Ovarian-specific serine/threonine-protein kinase, putative / transcript_product=Ovarian-specific serine/threonine-protein kinase, putative / location=Cvel_scaffold2961:14478-19886(+) / protein_length=247 / sequence_SO=supercontig / SO=protein_coding / is_pseudo=false
MGGGCSNVTVDPALRDKYTVGKEIGRGAYGIIREAKAKPPARSLGIPEKVAIKIFTKTNNPAGTRTPNEMRLRKLKSDFNHNRFIDEEDKAMAKANIAVLQRIDATEVRKSPLEQILHEVKVLTDLKHPCMVEMHEWVQSEDRIYMVMELCTGGNLQMRVLSLPSSRNDCGTRWTAEQCLAHPFFFQNLPEGWSKPPITVSAPHAAMGGLRSKRMSIHGAEVDMEEQMKMFQSQGLAGDDHEEEDSP